MLGWRHEFRSFRAFRATWSPASLPPTRRRPPSRATLHLEQDARSPFPCLYRLPPSGGARRAVAASARCRRDGRGHVSTTASLCERCDAVCCRLTVVLQPEDRVAPHLTVRTRAGLHVMDRDEEGWCVAIDAARMCCSIYATRPQVCRRFAMGGPYCREVREDYTDRNARGIPLAMY